MITLTLDPWSAVVGGCMLLALECAFVVVVAMAHAKRPPAGDRR